MHRLTVVEPPEIVARRSSHNPLRLLGIQLRTHPLRRRIVQERHCRLDRVRLDHGKLSLDKIRPATDLGPFVRHARLQTLGISAEPTRIEQRDWTRRLLLVAHISAGLIVDLRASKEALATLARNDSKVNTVGWLLANAALDGGRLVERLRGLDADVHANG